MNDRLSKLFVGSDFLLLHDWSGGRVGLVGCTRKQDRTVDLQNQPCSQRTVKIVKGGGSSGPAVGNFR